MWSAFRIDTDLLVTTEFNYGVPLMIIVIAKATPRLRYSVLSARVQHVGAVTSSQPSDGVALNAGIQCPLPTRPR